MYATHPKTGKQIRVMKSDTSIWKNSKTLTWMKEPYNPKNKSWKRWDILVTQIQPEFLKWSPDIVVLTEETAESNAWLKTEDAKKIRFILVSMKAIENLNSEKFDVSSLGNVICLDEFHSVYPFLGRPWAGTTEDAIVCAAVIFRYNKIIGMSAEMGSDRMSNLLIQGVKLEFFETHKIPEPLVLIQQYYKPSQKIREAELRKCLAKNIENEYIDEIILFTETNGLSIPPDPLKKVKCFPLKTRLSYANCIDTIQKTIGPGKLVAFANTDIYLDSSWRNIWSVNLHDIFVALLRWEESQTPGKDHTLFGPRNDSQDCWLIHSDSVLDRTWNLSAFNIPFGKAGCDNAILTEFLRNKFKIVNPATNLRTIHVHASEIRNYDKTDIVERPVYMFVEPTGIHELNPIVSWDGWAGNPVPYEPLDRPLRATNPKHLNTFCSQMNRDPAFVWAVDGLNTYLPTVGQDRPIHIDGGAFVSPTGLVYKHTEICVGTTEIQKTAWSENRLSHLMPSFNADMMMAFQLETEWLDTPALYTLYYLSKVIQQNEITPHASFWCKRTIDLLSAIQLFQWDRAQGRLLEHSEQNQCFARHVVGRTCHGTRPVKRDIDALREATDGKWSSFSMGRHLLIVCDSYHMNGDLVSRISSLFQERGFQVNTVASSANAKQWASALSGVSHVILSTSLKNIPYYSWAWMWLAPLGCKILELQEEREPSDQLLHLCAASGQEWTLLQYPRSTPDGFKKIVEKEVSKWLDLVGGPVKVDVTPIEVKVDSTIPFILETMEQIVILEKPCIFTPPVSMKLGFFGHKGDSFREMIDLWVERGYVERKEDPALTQCWLGGVGETLLYDRPTWSWLEKAPAGELAFKTCLAGNPDPAEKPGAKAWTFWPRNPRLVEEMATSPRPFQDRPDNMVFFGRIENDVQAKWRSSMEEEWSKACSKFTMNKTSEPYSLGPKEYLEALSLAKYGLCLRGYGPKCNREVELLAMGTVPIITDGVDFTNYSEPLVDGIHVIKVAGPEEAISKISAMTEEQWTAMSQAGHAWWKRNASVEGSWAITRHINAGLN
jgi:hypothetical protein